MIDLHAHILPGLDDGPATMDDAVALAREAVAAGTSTVVATPHVSELYRNEPGEIQDAARELARALRRAAIPLEIRTGAEIAGEALVDLPDDVLRQLTLGGGPYLLLESPLAASAGDVAPLVGLAQQRGFRVVLAHPERSPQFQREPEQLHRLAASGVLMSITAAAVTGGFGRPPRKLVERMLTDGLVHNICSDMHDRARRPPTIADGLAAGGAAGAALATELPWLAGRVPEAILSGDRLPPMPASLAGTATRRPSARRWWRR